jgi:F420-dependent oxidoreductase-like protein
MKVGLQLPNFTWPGAPAKFPARLARIARAADRAGFDSLWVMDHFFQIGGPERRSGLGPAEDEMLECYTTLGYLAGLTKRVRLGAMVTGVIYRHPGILVKTVTTLDVVSGGRAYFGIGAAWFEREARGLGVPFPPIKERFERLEETLQITQQMWSGDNGPYTGRHFQLVETLCHPEPLSKPHPPILIGGMGEKQTLRLVAKYADACNLFARTGEDVIRAKLDVLKRHCDMAGRDYHDIEKTTLNTVHIARGKQTPGDVIAECRALAGLGIQHCIFNMPNVHELKPLRVFRDEIIPAVKNL